MEQLLRKSTVQLTGCALDRQEECPISGEYTLPEYCPDMAVVLKTFADPRIQNRQWSGDQLLLDGNAVIRVLYLDEERRCVRALEFTQPFSCTLRGDERADNASVELDLSTKYLNCRALSPRRVEVRGAVVVSARADCAVNKTFVTAMEDSGLYSRTETVPVTVPGGVCDKVLSVSESLEFDDTLPPAEMLLGGECRAVIRECKLLGGKAIIKGQVYVHQLYTDDTDGVHTHCLDYTLPFSQIMDIDDAREGMPYRASVQILSDTERCSVGPDGENTVLDVTVKLLIQVQVYHQEELSLLLDAYHSRFPVAAQTEEIEVCSFIGARWENAALPMQLSVPAGRWSEILDIAVQPQTLFAECQEDRAEVKGRMSICVLARDADGEIVYDEFVEEYGLQYDCNGNEMLLKPKVTDLQYRTVGDKLELQVKLCVAISEYQCSKQQFISDLHLQSESPYPQQRFTALLYYAERGEKVWDIGRSCHTSPMSIMEENGMTHECISENTVIVVPVLN